MLLGKVFDHNSSQTHQKYLVNRPQVCWQFLFRHRTAAVVKISDEAGETKLEMQHGKLVWPMDDELKREVQARFAALEEAEWIAHAS
jgi:hypothetical protein